MRSMGSCTDGNTRHKSAVSVNKGQKHNRESPLVVTTLTYREWWSLSYYEFFIQAIRKVPLLLEALATYFQFSVVGFGRSLSIIHFSVAAHTVCTVIHRTLAETIAES